MNVQVDLVMFDPMRTLTVLEVKTQGASGLAHVTWAQRERLERVCDLLAQWQPVEFKLATIRGSYVQVFGLD